MHVVRRFDLALLAAAGLAAVLSWAFPARGQAAPGGGAVGAIPKLRPPPALEQLAGRPITRIEIVPVGKRWAHPVQLQRVRVGDPLSLEIARRAMRELLDTGHYASARAQAIPNGRGVTLRIFVLPRRLIATVKVIGGLLDDEDTLRAAEVREGGEVTEPELPKIAHRVGHFYAEHGYPAAHVRVSTIDTDDPMRVVLLINIDPGAPLKIARRVFRVAPFPAAPGLSDLIDDYDASPGDRVDQERLENADRTLEGELRAHGWFRATVEHGLKMARSGRSELVVTVRAGPLMRLRFWGNHHFDASQLEPALEIKTSEDRTTGTLVQRLHDFYVKRGFLDVEVHADERGAPGAAIHDLVFTIREHRLVHVTQREYPCLTGPRSPKQVGSELDDVLSDDLPGSGILSSVNPNVVDSTFGPRHPTGARVVPFEPNPLRTYVPEVYARALKHLQELYRSEGYLTATVGPVQVLRRRCSIYSPPGRCVPLGPPAHPRTACLYDSIGRPVSQPTPDPRLTCKPDPAKGISCESNVTLRIPIKLGPRTRLYDIAFEGNKALYEKQLEKVAGLDLGAPVSLAEIEKARRRVLDAYAEQGYAFAEVDTAIDYSPDHTRARVRFIISEREQVRVAGIIVMGAQRTSESLIRSRVALTVGQPYRRSEVRETEERLATLGVFSSVTVGLEDPYVPAKRKMVVVTVQERLPQYLDIRPGFSTGEGLRIAFEYGHRNLGGEAIRLTLRVELGYLPSAFIFENDVRQKFNELDVGQRLERQDTATVEFPDVGLGPLFRLSVEGVDVRNNARDYGLTKDAGIVTLIYHPNPHFSAQVGGSLELNTAEIFGNQQKDALQSYVEQNPGLRDAFRVPQGTTLAIAQRIGFTWDRRDNPFDATRGTLLSASVEHVRANPVGQTAQNAGGAATDVFAPTTSDFLRFTSRVAGYIRLSQRGLALAASFSWGYNLQLLTPCRDPNANHALGHCSATYPDRLFFMGGVDTIRGFLQDSLIPEDIAQELLHPSNPQQPLTVNDVVIRGGDFFVNPRLELRIPLTGSVQTALFVDAGNLWSDPTHAKPWNLRYAVGSGLRIGTPIGPLAFDYGFNVDRVLDALFPSRKNQRYWEDIGAFHFSIGLF